MPIIAICGPLLSHLGRIVPAPPLPLLLNTPCLSYLRLISPNTQLLHSPLTTGLPAVIRDRLMDLWELGKVNSFLPQSEAANSVCVVDCGKEVFTPPPPVPQAMS